jgi:glycosyltransferase involved in cell wall biosynthesis
MKRVSKEELEALRNSDLFDEKYYLEQYPDVQMLGMDPLEHYMWVGKRLGRTPNRTINDSRSSQSDHNVSTSKLVDYSCPNFWDEFEFKDLDSKDCSYFSPKGRIDSFKAWQLFNGRNRNLEWKIQNALNNYDVRSTTFSVIVPVYDPPLDVLREAVDSVLAQSYPNFELVLVDDFSKNPEVRSCLSNIHQKDSRIKVILRDNNGHISAATNDAANLASGDFLVFLDNDDRLSRHALAAAAIYIHSNNDTDIIYSDDAKIGDDNAFLHSPKFKPGWSPELLLSYCYVSHLKVIRRSLYMEIGGSRLGFEGSQDHDMLLRAGERARHIGHIPQILYERRVLPGSTALSGNAKPYSFEAGRRAAEEAFNRRGVECRVEHPEWARNAGAGIYVPVMPDHGPEVTLIIPTRNNWRILQRLIESLRATTYCNYSILVVDNDSDDPESIRYYQSLKHCRIEKISNPGSNFSYAHINNRAVELVDSPYVLFLNDDTEVISPRWLSQMVGWSKLSGVGAVGARLLYPNGKVQHGGVTIGLRCGLTAFRGLEGNKPGYLWYARVTRNTAAVTAACMLTPRKLFSEMGGFDEQAFPVAFNDVDYCLRLLKSGNRSVYCGEAELYHHEGYSRPKGDRPTEIANLKARYGFFEDPYYSPHLGVDDNRYGIKPTVVPLLPSNRPIKVLAVTHNLNHEGAPNSAFELLSAMRERGKVDLTIVSPQDGPLRKKYEEKGIEVRILPRPRPLEGVADMSSYNDRIETFVKNVDLGQFDVLYANTATAFWAIDAAARESVPSIWNIRESESWKTYFRDLPHEVAHKAIRAFSSAYRVIFVADSTRRRWSPIDRIGNFTTIHNGLDIDRLSICSQKERRLCRDELNIKHDKISILALGTTAPRKGQHDLLKAIASLDEIVASKIHVSLVGLRNTRYGNAIKQFANFVTSKNGCSISVFDETGDTSKFWNAADLFVMTSRLESYPRVILEAMAHQLPIISTPVFGVKEQVREDINAMLYNPGDTLGLAKLIAKCVEDRGILKSMRHHSSDVLAGLESYEGMVEKYERLMLAAADSAVPNEQLVAA